MSYAAKCLLFFPFALVLAVLRFNVNDYPFGIFKLFLYKSMFHTFRFLTITSLFRCFIKMHAQYY